MSTTTPEPIRSAARMDREGPALPFSNTIARLPERFFARVNPTPVRAPQLLQLNEELADRLGLDAGLLASPAGVALLAGNSIPGGAQPLAQAYAGHQFGHFVPQLGDGRAILLGELLASDGVRYDVQLKGPGRTPFSRGGDGRAAIGPVLREYLVSEGMTALGVPSTRALAAVATGETVMRETPLPGAVLTRVAQSHLRVGSFQFFAVRGDTEAVRTLADYALQRHYSEAAHAPKPYRALLAGVIGRQARLVAQWLSLGFVHGVLNTDNTSISGETLDYGPCAFLEAYDPATVFSSIDRNGRYAYRNQPAAMLWNLMRLAEAMLPALEAEEGSEQGALEAANEVLAAFEPQFEEARAARFGAKLGLRTRQSGDSDLLEDLLGRMTAGEADFTLFFRLLGEAAADPACDAQVKALFTDPGTFAPWAERWRRRLSAEDVAPGERRLAMHAVNPAYIPRNHLVEEALTAASTANDLQPFRELLAAITRPYEERPGLERFGSPARPEQRVERTFCGT